MVSDIVVHREVMTVPHASHPFFVFRNAAASVLQLYFVERQAIS